MSLGDRNGFKNISREELDLLKDLVISTTEESWKVEKIELGELEYSCDLTLKHMGDFLFISQSYFSEIMTQETGVTFSEYLTITRIEAAKALLLNDRNMKIYAVARKVGYVDSKYFSQIFRRYTGVTPNQFRGD